MIELSDFYPSPDALIASEVAVLAYLQDNPYIKAVHPQVARDAQAYYARNRKSSSGFEFNSHFDVQHSGFVKVKNARKKPSARLTLSAGVWVNNRQFTNVTYCLAVCRTRASQTTILRKFHCDIAVDANGRAQEHPRCHLQYCGKMVPYMAEIGCRDAQLEQMHPWLSEPRIFFWPMSLALLIDLALHEFPDQASAKFRADNYWRKLVRDQERLVLLPFYTKCVEVIGDKKDKVQTLADAFYVR